MFGCQKYAILLIPQIPLGYYPFQGVIPTGDLAYWLCCLLPAPKHLPFLKSYNFLYHECYAVSILFILISSTVMLAIAIKDVTLSTLLLVINSTQHELA